MDTNDIAKMERVKNVRVLTKKAVDKYHHVGVGKDDIAKILEPILDALDDLADMVSHARPYADR